MGNWISGEKPVPPKTRFDMVNILKPVKNDDKVACWKKTVNKIKYIAEYILYVISWIPLGPTAVLLTAYDKTRSLAKKHVKPLTDKTIKYVKDTASKYPTTVKTLKYVGLTGLVVAGGTGACLYGYPAVCSLI